MVDWKSSDPTVFSMEMAMKQFVKQTQTVNCQSPTRTSSLVQLLTRKKMSENLLDASITDVIWDADKTMNNCSSSSRKDGQCSYVAPRFQDSIGLALGIIGRNESDERRRGRCQQRTNTSTSSTDHRGDDDNENDHIDCNSRNNKNHNGDDIDIDADDVLGNSNNDPTLQMIQEGINIMCDNTMKGSWLTDVGQSQSSSVSSSTIPTVMTSTFMSSTSTSTTQQQTLSSSPTIQKQDPSGAYNSYHEDWVGSTIDDDTECGIKLSPPQRDRSRSTHRRKLRKVKASSSPSPSPFSPRFARSNEITNTKKKDRCIGASGRCRRGEMLVSCRHELGEMNSNKSYEDQTTENGIFSSNKKREAKIRAGTGERLHTRFRLSKNRYIPPSHGPLTPDDIRSCWWTRDEFDSMSMKADKFVKGFADKYPHGMQQLIQLVARCHGSISSKTTTSVGTCHPHRQIRRSDGLAAENYVSDNTNDHPQYDRVQEHQDAESELTYTCCLFAATTLLGSLPSRSRGYEHDVILPLQESRRIHTKAVLDAFRVHTVVVGDERPSASASARFLVASTSGQDLDELVAARSIVLSRPHRIFARAMGEIDAHIASRYNQ